VAGIPSGTVTLLFTDIEGSTRLLDELGPEGYRDALGEHRRLLRELFDRHDGYEVDYEGDAFFVAFERAGDAVAVARKGQKALAGGPVRVRMGLHTGEPLLDPPKYVGRDVHLTARVMAAGHGGQVLLTRATRALVDADVRDLGEHRLKDFDEPVSLFQLGDQTFPPLRTISNTNLPRPASSFLGREAELAEAEELLTSTRLLTIAGPGGTGKTRFSIELVSGQLERFPSGVFWVPLAALRDPALVLETVDQVVGGRGALSEHIADRRMLLLLDNFEHVIEAAPGLSALLGNCPNLTVVVTSRELLRVAGEREYPLPPLVPEEGTTLFCERARTERTPAVEELCRRLDNMPLGLELAAARARVLSVEQILERLAQRLDLFRGGRDADPRQQTLRATIEWSYELLTQQEQELFARLSVFASGCTLESAEEVAEADLDILQSLVDKSLLRRTEERFWMLETIRDYASEQLEQLDEAPKLRRRHADHFLGVALSVDEELRGPDQEAWMQRVGQEHANLAAAMIFFTDEGPVESALRMGAGLARYWARRGAVAEGRTLIERALDRGSGAPPGVRGGALWGAAHLAYMQDDFERERACHEEARTLFSAAGDARGRLLNEIELAWMELALGEVDAAESKAAQCAAEARVLADDWLLAFALQLRGAVLTDGGELDQARLAYGESVALFDSVGDSRSSLAAGSTLGWIAVLGEDYEEAASLLAAAVAHAAGSDPELLAVNRSNLGLAYLFLGNDEGAADEFAASLSMSGQMGARRYAAEALLGLAAVAARASLPEAAARLRSISLAFHDAFGARLNPGEERVDKRFLADLRQRVPPDDQTPEQSTTLEDATAYATEVVETIRLGSAPPRVGGSGYSAPVDSSA
jgi:predicted ATPase